MELPHDEIAKDRRQGIGGSDAAAVAGLSPWATPMQIWLEKTGQMESPDLSDNESVYWGTMLESLVATEFARRTNMWVQRRNTRLTHPKYPFMVGNVDRLIRPERSSGEWGVLECKTSSEFARSQWAEENVPPQYLIQLQHYLAVTGYSYGYLAVLIGGNKYRHYKVGRDDALIDSLIDIEQRFWVDHVQANEPPPWDGSEQSTALLAKLYPEATQPEPLALPATAKNLIDDHIYAAAMVTEWEHKKTEAANKLKGLLGDHEQGTVGDHTVRWGTINQFRLDTKALQSAHPDIYSQYLKLSTYRRFGIK